MTVGVRTVTDSFSLNNSHL